MKATKVYQEIPNCVKRLGSVKQFFLDEEKPIDEQSENFQKILQAIWGLVSVFYPLDRMGDTVMEIPSHRLAELGFVSEKTKMRIEKRRLRRQKKNGYIADVEKNIIVIIRTDSGFILTETYVIEEEFLGSGIRRDCVVKDWVYLETAKKELKIRIERETAEYHIHILSAIWRSQDAQSTEQRQCVEITAKRVNIIFALLLEGICPSVF